MRYFESLASLSRSAIEIGVVEAEDAGQLGDGRPAPIRSELVRGGYQAFPLDGRGQDHGPGPVEDVATPARRVDRDARLGERLGGEAVPVDDLPVAEPSDERDRTEDEDTQEEEQSAARIGSAQHRSIDRLAGRQDERLGQLAETGVEGLLADGRLATEAVEVRADVERGVIESLSLELEATDVEAGRADPDLLREREEGEHERDDDPAEDQPEAIGPATCPERATDAPALECRALRDARPPGQGDGARAGALVDGHPSVAEREADARTARVEEPERVGLGARAPLPELEFEAFRVLAAVLAFAHLVLTTTVGLATVRGMALAHVGSSFRSWG